MPLYRVPLRQIDAGEARRYAGLMRAPSFDEAMIREACEEALLLADPCGIWETYGYDCRSGTVLSDPPVQIRGEAVGKHLAGCSKALFLAATVGDGIERRVAELFEEGRYAASLLLDAAATAAVEQVADGMEQAIRPAAAREGLAMRWRFSPGYGDWPLEQQPEAARLGHASEIGIRLSDALMLVPRKSITAVIGLAPNEGAHPAPCAAPRCAACGRRDCASRAC